MKKDLYSVFIRYVWDTNGNFETYYGHSAKRIIENVSYKKAIKTITTKYNDLNSGEYLELYNDTLDKSIAYFGYFNHKGDRKQDNKKIGFWFENKKGSMELKEFTIMQIKEALREKFMEENK